MQIDVRPIQPGEVECIVDIAVRAWGPVHASMAAVLGERINRRVYPDWATSQAADARSACVDPSTQVFIAVESDAVCSASCRSWLMHPRCPARST